MGRERREAAPRAGAREPPPPPPPVAVFTVAAGFKTGGGCSSGGAGRPHSFLERPAGGRGCGAHWQPPPGRPGSFLRAGSGAHVLPRPAAPEAGDRVPEPSPERVGAVRPAFFVRSAPARRGPGGGGRRRRAVRGSQTLPHARGEEISTPAAIL